MASYWDKYTPEQKAYVLKKRKKGIRKVWANYTPEQKAERDKGLVKARMAHSANAKKRRELLVEVDVVRINDYAGTITESQMRELYA